MGNAELLKMECLLPDEEDVDEACCRIETFVTNWKLLVRRLKERI